jgi:hypothetical protein
MDFIDDQLLADVTKDLCRSGEILRVKELRNVAKRITAEQGVEFYCYLRDNSERFESEWRDAFSKIFPKSAALLPSEILFCLIDEGDLIKVKEFLKTIGTLDTCFKPAEALNASKYNGFGAEADYMPFDIYPIQGENDDGISAVEYARQKKQSGIADFLESVITEITRRFKAAYVAGYKERGAQG